MDSLPPGIAIPAEPGWGLVQELFIDTESSGADLAVQDLRIFEREPGPAPVEAPSEQLSKTTENRAPHRPRAGDQHRVQGI